MKLPIQLTKVDLPDVMYIPIRIEVGPANKNEINETLEGLIVGIYSTLSVTSGLIFSLLHENATALGSLTTCNICKSMNSHFCKIFKYDGIFDESTIT